MLEGDWEPTRLVVLEFEDLEAAKRWYDSRRVPGGEEAARGRRESAHGRGPGRLEEAELLGGRRCAPTSASSGSGGAIGSSERPSSSGSRAKSDSSTFSIAGV